MNKLDNLKKQEQKLFQKSGNLIMKLTDKLGWDVASYQKRDYQIKFLRTWKKYNKNEIKYQREFLEVSAKFANAIQVDIDLQQIVLKKLKPVDDEIKKIRRKMARLRKIV